MRAICDVSNTIDRWLCKHSDQIMSMFNVIGIIFCLLLFIGSIMFGRFSVTELYQNPDVVRWVLCGGWIISSVAGVCLSLYYAWKCIKAIKKHGWRASW